MHYNGYILQEVLDSNNKPTGQYIVIGPGGKRVNKVFNSLNEAQRWIDDQEEETDSSPSFPSPSM